MDNRGDDVGFVKAILLALMFLLSTDINAKSTCSALFENYTSSFSDFYKQKSQAGIPSENSSYELLRAVSTVYESKVVKSKKMEIAFSFKENTVFISDRLPTVWQTQGKTIPIRPILTLHAILEKSLIRYGIEPALARQMGFQIQKSVIEALDLNWSEYITFMRPYFESHAVAVGKTPISSQKVLEAMEQFSQLIEIDYSYQIPYLAGYSKNNSKKIYIDKEMPREFIYRGKKVNPTSFLVIHEVVEKILIDELKLKSESYLPTHQIAQRLEMAAVLASGISWKAYQHEFMGQEILRSEDSSRALVKIPVDLDLTPYRDSKDFELIRKMRAAMKPQENIQNNLFTVRQLQPGIFYLLFNDRIDLSKTMIRFQEHFESPQFKDQVFSRKEFEAWYRQKNNGKFDYYDFWGDGFNIPSHILETFYRGEFKNLTRSEKLILDQFKNRRHTKYYIIATAKNSETKTFDHEIAHALYYLNPKYREEVESVLREIDITPVEKFLKEFYGDYHDSVLRDEAHAWLMHNSKDLQKDGFDISPYIFVTEKLQRVYLKYSR